MRVRPSAGTAIALRGAVTRGIGKWLGFVWLFGATLVPVQALMARAQVPQRYAIVDLGTLGGGSSEAAAVNILGDVVGFSTTASGARRAFLYRSGEMFDLGTLQGGTTSEATAITDSGIVVGNSGINAYGPQFREFTQGFVWQDGVMRPIGALYCPCGYNTRHGTSRAFDASNLGRVVGGSLTNRQVLTHAFVWDANTMRDLGNAIDGAFSSAAYGINDIDDIVGTFDERAFLLRGGVREDLGVLPGHTSSSARAVNIIGQVVGESVSAGGVAQAFLWDRGTLRSLGTLPGDAASEAKAINVAGDAVGRSGLTDFSRSRAVLWRNGLALDLNTLTAAAGWTLVSATGINDVGQIVGVGRRDGQVRAFLLGPQ